MDNDPTLAQIKTVFHLIGIVLVLMAAVKLFGYHGLPGNISEIALVGIGLINV